MTEADRRRDTTNVRISPLGLEGILGLPRPAGGIVLFAHGSGSGRFSPRNNYVAAALRRAGLGNAAVRPADRRTRPPTQQRVRHRPAGRATLRWPRPGVDSAKTLREPADRLLRRQHRRRGGAGRRGARSDGRSAPWSRAAGVPTWPARRCSTGAGADAAHRRRARCRRAGAERAGVRAAPVREKRLEIVPGATHLFEEPGALDQVIDLARQWFTRHLTDGSGEG